jgi:hypothetical protein
VTVDHRHRSDWVPSFETGPDCIPLERLDQPVTGPDRQHVDGCARCQTERALWREFSRPTPASDEGAAVEWVVVELRRRFAAAVGRTAPAQFRPWLGSWRFAAAAVMFTIGTAAGYVAWDREPGIRGTQRASQVYRTAGLQAIAPLGDVSAPPQAIEWAPFRDAAVYDIDVFEVNRATLWRGLSSVPRVELPPSLSVQFAPGKTVLWQVKAMSASGVVIADSGTQRFRVSAIKKTEH